MTIPNSTRYDADRQVPTTTCGSDRDRHEKGAYRNGARISDGGGRAVGLSR